MMTASSAAARQSNAYPVAPEDPRLSTTIEWVAARLRRLCLAMPTEEFQALVREVALFHLRLFPRGERPDGRDGA